MEREQIEQSLNKNLKKRSSLVKKKDSLLV